MRDPYPNLVVGNFTVDVLEDWPQVRSAMFIHGSGDGAVGFRADPRIQSLWTMGLDELREVAPTRAWRAACYCSYFLYAGPFSEQLEGRFFGVCWLAYALAARKAADNHIHRDVLSTAIVRDMFDKLLS